MLRTKPIILQLLTYFRELPETKCFLWATGFGACTALSLPPIYALPFLVVGISGLLLLSENIKKLKTALFTGWFFGMGYYVVSLYWISAALTIDLSQHIWFIPLSLVALPSYLSIYPAIVLTLVCSSNKQGLSRLLAFAILWTIGEYIQSFAFTGFPWSLVGYSLCFNTSLCQGASLFGIYGMSFLAITVGGSFFLLEPSRRENAFAFFMILGLILSLFLWGEYRLRNSSEEKPTNTTLRLVQPNISQKLKWDPANRQANLETLMTLSKQSSDRHIDAIIWAESAFPYSINVGENEEEVGRYLSSILKENVFLFTGANLTTLAENIHDDREVWNSLVVVDSLGKLQESYEKSHLTPFGEYIPWRSIIQYLGPVSKVTQGTRDFSEGKGLKSLKVGDLPTFSPLICYEAIFPREVTSDGSRPQWLLNITNDGWYGNSTGPYQHFQIARVRAIEEGLPMVRVANTGISGVVDAYGRIKGSLPLSKKGILDISLPKAISTPPAYARWGNLFALLIILGLSAFLKGSTFLFSRMRRR